MDQDFQTTSQKLVSEVIRTGAAATSSVDEEERRLVVQAIVVGVVVWAVVTVLKSAAHWGFHQLTEWMSNVPSVLFVLIPLTVGALIVASVAHLSKAVVYFRDAHGHLHELNAVEGDGLERAIGLYFSSEPSTERALLGTAGVQARWELPTFTLAMQKLFATFVTLSTGGSGGLEASVTLIGESTSAALFKPHGFLRPKSTKATLFSRLTEWWQSTRPEDLRAAQLCGVSAAIATLLGTPFAAAFFAIEVMYRRRPIIDKLIYALISSLIAFFLAHMFGAESPFHAQRSSLPMLYELRYYGALVALGVCIAGLGMVFGKLRIFFDRLFHDRVANRWARHGLGAVATGLIAFAAALLLKWTGSYEAILGNEGGPGAVVSLVLGSGESVIEAALLGELTATVALIALAAKLLATLTTITSGGSAGLLFPTMFFGTTVAVLLSHFFGFSDPVVLIAPALTASLVSIVNVPLAAIFVVVELFGADWIVPALFMLVITSILTHKNSIYRTQHETFDTQEIAPGIAVRHLDVPTECAGRTLADLDVRQVFGLTIVGILTEAAPGTVETKLEPNPERDRALQVGEQLVAIGHDDAFAAWLAAFPPESPGE